MNTLNIRNINTENNQYSIWFPYKKPNAINDLCITSGKGIRVYDIYDKEYIDLSCGLWNVTLGYGNEEIINAINQQASKLAYCSLFENSNEMLLSSSYRLIDYMKLSNSKVIYGCSGSESIEIAIKVMRQYWSIQGEDQKKLILSFSNSYHGTSYGAMSISDLEKIEFSKISPMLSLVATVMPKYEGRDCLCCNVKNECNELQELRSFIENNRNIIAGIVIEPMLSSKGAFSICNQFLINLVNICKHNNIIVTFDEIATGFYRCGTRFYYSKLKVAPDIVCISKAINSGYLPLGATVISEKLIHVYDDSNSTLPHGSTQGGNLVSCAAMNASLSQYLYLESKENLLDKGILFFKILKEKLSDVDCINQVRGEGFFYSIDLQCDDIPLTKFILMIRQMLKNKGIIVYYSEVGLSILPMLITELDEWKMIVDRIYCVLKDVG